MPMIGKSMVFRMLGMASALCGSVAAAAGPAAAKGTVVQNRDDGADAALVASAWGGAPRGLEGLAAAAPGALYYTGPVGREADGLVLTGAGARVAVNDWLARQQADHAPDSGDGTVVILNTCGTNMGIAAHDLDAPGDWLVAYPLAGGRCLPLDFARQVALATQGPVRDWPMALRQAGIGVAEPTARSSRPVGVSGLRAVENDSIVITTTLRPTNVISPRTTAPITANPVNVTPVAATPRDIPRPATTAAPLVEGTANRAVLPQGAGLPSPSIIVGEQAVPRPQLQRGPMGVAFAERARLRAEDAALFDRMVAEGAYDPEPDQIAAAIQTELARMECYGAAIDGIWGGGSNAAVQRYFQKAGGTAAASSAEVALYRQLILNPDVTCDPVPVAAPAAPSATSRGNARPAATQTGARPRNTTQQRPAATRQPAAQQPAATTSSPPRISPNLSGAGMFR